MELRDLIVLVTSLVGGGGLLGGIYALLKLRPEAGQITVSTAQGVLLMQTSVIEDQRAQIERLQNRLDVVEPKLRRMQRKYGENGDNGA